jgi:nitrite reductase/ring-hydroxylating ferredoxin subunit
MSTVALQEAGVYRRRVKASLPRIWENVFDWEHLPALHADSFGSSELISHEGDVQVVRITRPDGKPSVIRTVGDRIAHRYVVTTLEGVGTASEVRVQLTPLEPNLTDIEVRYHVPETRPERLARIAEAFVPFYARLWDEDEAMMIRREQQLRVRRGRSEIKAVRLGPLAEVEGSLPLLVDFGHESFRVIRHEGELIAHAAVCPHWLGPLEDAEVEDGAIRCPWHGWRFDVRSGENLEGRACRLPTPPQISIEDGVVSLTAAQASTD